jgi:site-specific recombinase XerD
MIVVQQLMGHANIQTTAQYDRSSEDTKRTAAVGLIHTPYRRHEN